MTEEAFEAVAPLNIKQTRFCYEYVASGNAYTSFLAAGYSERGAAGNSSRLLHMPEVQKLILKIESERLKALGATADWIAAQLMENHLKAQENGKISDSNKALELLGRRISMWVDRKEVTTRDATITHIESDYVESDAKP